MPSKKSTANSLQTTAKRKTEEKIMEEKNIQIANQNMVGIIVAAKMPETATVLVERTKTHPLYRKSYKRSKRYLVDNSLGAVLGDVVRIVKVRPISKNKHFKITQVVGKNIESIISEQIQEEAEQEIAEIMPEEKTEENVEQELSIKGEEKEEKTKNKKLIKKEEEETDNSAKKAKK
ncbi:MAG: 30S ribosomal protein S17 [Candidatus Daviesbacteria bacterium]